MDGKACNDEHWRTAEAILTHSDKIQQRGTNNLAKIIISTLEKQLGSASDIQANVSNRRLE